MKKTEKNGQAIIKQGLLRKQGGQYKSWKDRWFTLTSEALSYYKTVEAEDPIKRILLKEIKACRLESNDARPPSRSNFFFFVETEVRVYFINARSEVERKEWVDAINKCLPSPEKDQADKLAQELSTLSTQAATEIVPKPFAKKARAEVGIKPLTHEFSVEEYVQRMKELVRNSQLSDVIFHIQGNSYHAHKAIVSCRCPTLAKTWEGSAKGKLSEVNLEDLRPETFSSLLDFIYTGSVELSPANVVFVHSAACLYELDRLKSICEVYIRDNVSVNNILVMLVAANQLKEAEIERFLLGYMRDVNKYTVIIKQPQAVEIAQTNKDLYVTMSQVLAQPEEDFNNTLSEVQVGPLQLTVNVSALLDTLDYADLRIIAKDGEVFGHRVVVFAMCPLFLEEGSLGVEEDLQGPNPKFQILKFPTLDSQVLQVMLQILYSNVATLEYLEDTYGLIELADRVQHETVVTVCEAMMKQNLKKQTSLKILMVASEYELLELKKETLQLIVKEKDSVLQRKELRVILSQWPWNLIDIVRALVRGEGGDYTDDDEELDTLESEEEHEDDEPVSTEMS